MKVSQKRALKCLLKSIIWHFVSLKIKASALFYSVNVAPYFGE